MEKKSTNLLLKDLKRVSIALILMFIILYIFINIAIKNLTILFYLNLILSLASIILINLFLKRRFAYLDYIINTADKIIEEDISIKVDVKNNNSFSHLADNINTISSLAKESIAENIKNEVRDINFIKEISKNYDLEQEELTRLLDIEKNRLNLQMETFDLTEVIRDLTAFYKSELEAISIYIKYTTLGSSFLVTGDKRIIREALIQIYLNILRYTLPNSKVYIEIKEYDKNIYLSFKNVAKDDVSIDLIRQEKYKGIKFIENTLFLQDIKVNVSTEASLYKIIIVFKN